ncbi:Fpg/Nei family DNA glycosylase [Cryobacterium sp. TMT2-17-1]|uniref:DNA-(apurinic or apyrimidinic site) lyase n=1 Tax=Cryobacterium sandaracinum TaxID=1259247 RepID=A0ABY2JDG6_9MICO|nr:MULTISPECIES: DNA-formamidopyrimidine glycosylase family protein [Cryobacterium]TFB57085.1 Fpg/Nei family DNA glycosylase [Cryobacterium sp. Sr3]TFB58634.1 Fpg/Nei family DNA glycosylase [Cryobacterium sp. Hz7]TFC33267.1 Fpg/Nei family DNA glycosylase [Cryobacterium sp. TMT2-14]TFC52775.1 Fpg/Nei family DNA glycosylase [Cryobacterium sp. TMT2-17-1]TFC70227.1 Fpg/Nei family DNA glycosylase [Cryobacterium sp. TMT2-4]
MPEGHSVHRIARQFARNFVGKSIRLSSPQGRFVDGAAMLDGHIMTDARAVGKQMFLEFDNGLWLRVHLGLYGAWDFAGDIQAHGTDAAIKGRRRRTVRRDAGDVMQGLAGEDSLQSIGAPRLTRLRMAEDEKVSVEPDGFPPAPIGQVRVRLLADDVVADLRGPTACVVLDSQEVHVAMDRLGPDPMLDDSRAAEDRFVTVVRKKPTPIGRLLMDQLVVSGIGNVYRAELLFRARLNPYAPGKSLSDEQSRALWRDWAHLLKIGVSTGQMMTMDGLGDAAYGRALRRRADRHWVYKREGLPCRVCGTHITVEEMAARKLYWCPKCQA